MMRQVLVVLGCWFSVIKLNCAELPAEYLGLSAHDKQDILWKQVTSTAYDLTKLPTAIPNDATLSTQFNLTFAATVFSNASDEHSSRARPAHPYGTVAKVMWRSFGNSSFTGIFLSGGIGIVRLSIITPDIRMFAPAMVLKILMDGRPSVNFHALFSLDGQAPNMNFFQNTFSNIVALKPLKYPRSLFGQDNFPDFNAAINLIPGGPLDRPLSAINVPVYQGAITAPNGKTVCNAVAPFWLGWVPNPALGWDPNSPTDYRLNIAKIPEGTVLYTIMARWLVSSPEQVIGQLVTQSPFVASAYGDTTLFFEHQAKRWLPTVP